MHRNAESTNQELRAQILKLRIEIQEVHKPLKIDREVQTEDCSLSDSYKDRSHTDSYDQNAYNGSDKKASQAGGPDLPEHQDVTRNQCEEEEQETYYTQEDSGVTHAESFMVTPEAALPQTGLTYDENMEMYCEQGSGFDYDSGEEEPKKATHKTHHRESSWLGVIEEEGQKSAKSTHSQRQASGPSYFAPMSYDLSDSEEEVFVSRDDSSSAASEDENTGHEDTSRPLFAAEDTERLLQMVWVTVDTEEKKESTFYRDVTFEGSEEKRKFIFPIHSTISDLIFEEWKNPEKRSFIPTAVKRKYPFDSEATSSWGCPPKIDVSITKIVHSSSRPVKEMDSLKDPLDRKADSLLRKTWESSTAAFKPIVAAASVTRAVLMWLSQLGGDVKNKIPREVLSSSIANIQKGAAFLADASVDGLRLLARTASLSNSARRALWLRNCPWDVTSRNRLCGIPCEGNLVFGPVLDDWLQKKAEERREYTPKAKQAKHSQAHWRARRQKKGKNPRAQFSKPPQKNRGFNFNQPRTAIPPVPRWGEDYYSSSTPGNRSREATGFSAPF
ncbi:hypothetical protein GDO81_002683 [Engystomops pustulosus]|uniref:Lamina-associated polypeptide 2 alpha C-terminal domain-containing protein n=1 Tax=Engystomops pustulosus TaxID=76066 RepID=A0AAV7DM60_ENGPU|nr:hypothetical protein GDO81_002683 [Engystomops pustulosus]KAG8598635.1 hypothetical protein GDO81_002683 [Engystomops pustulosus]